jgi:hypothetical protein
MIPKVVNCGVLTAMIFCCSLMSAVEDADIATRFEKLHVVPGEKFSSLEFFAVAQRLAKSGKSAALGLLRSRDDIAKKSGSFDRRNTLLMANYIFSARDGSAPRRPGIGVSDLLLSGKDSSSLVSGKFPLVNVGGAVVLMANSFLMVGQPEDASDYLKYCEDFCIIDEAVLKSINTKPDVASIMTELKAMPWWSAINAEAAEKLVRIQLGNESQLVPK